MASFIKEMEYFTIQKCVVLLGFLICQQNLTCLKRDISVFTQSQQVFVH